MPIEPRPGCNAFFALSALTGELLPHLAENTSAHHTLEVLQLNTPSLARTRLQWVRMAQNQPDILAEPSIPFRWTLHQWATPNGV